ncbi:MAG: hypothetical protein LBJ82_05515, partial [Deltaproteobacteria bacterium]|nr:hypothetical protein [Deltaproteobacteria bacterium]
QLISVSIKNPESSSSRLTFAQGALIEDKKVETAMRTERLSATSRTRVRNLLTALISCSFATACLALALRGLL